MLRYGKTKYLLERCNEMRSKGKKLLYLSSKDIKDISEMKGVMPDLKGLIFYLSDGGRL